MVNLPSPRTKMVIEERRSARFISPLEVERFAEAEVLSISFVPSPNTRPLDEQIPQRSKCTVGCDDVPPNSSRLIPEDAL